MVMERSYPIWWFNKFRERVSKSRDRATEKSTSPSMSFNPGNRRQMKTRWTEYSGLMGAKESMENRYEGSPEERVW